NISRHLLVTCSGRSASSTSETETLDPCRSAQWLLPSLLPVCSVLAPPHQYGRRGLFALRASSARGRVCSWHPLRLRRHAAAFPKIRRSVVDPRRATSEEHHVRQTKG